MERRFIRDDIKKPKLLKYRGLEGPEFILFLITKLRAFGALYLVSHRHPYKPRGIYYSNKNATVKLARDFLFPFWREYRRGVARCTLGVI